VYVSLENDPLLFVHGPPVYRHVREVTRWQEESTSIFPEPVVKAVIHDPEPVVKAVIHDPEPVVKTVEVDSLMWNRLNFLMSKFAKQVYKPLCFQLQDGEKVCGVVDALHPESVQIKLAEGEITAIEIQEIQEIWWGGRILPIRT
jgi:hypothetical protein